MSFVSPMKKSMMTIAIPSAEAPADRLAAHALAVDGDDRVAGAKAHGRRGRLRIDLRDVPLDTHGDPEHRDDRERDDGEERVRRRTGEDDEDALPGGRPT